MSEETQNQNEGPVSTQPEESKRMEHIKGLEEVVDTLTEDVVKALDIKEEKAKFKEKIRKLKQQEIQLEEVVSDLKSTREKLQQELRNKEDQISVMQSKIENLKEERADLSSEKVSLQEQIKNLQTEKSDMAVSLEKTTDMLTKLRHQIESFDEEIKG